jgi:hypothetical protein
VEHPPRGADGADGVVLVHGGHAEDGHDRVADELLDRAALGLDLGCQRREEVPHQVAELLRVERFRPPRRADDVREEDGDELQHLLRRLRGRSGRGLGRRFRPRRGRRQRQVEARVLPEDQPLELAERRRRLDAELVGEQAPRLLVRDERVRLPARPVEREHLLPPQPLPERLSCDERLELADEIAVPPE